MRKSLYLFLASFLALCILCPPTTFANDQKATAELIIQTDGPPDALAAFIHSLGGTVKFRYRNVPAVAATIPPSKLPDVVKLQGVTKVEKDRMVYLHDNPYPGEQSDYPMAYFISDMEGVQFHPIEPKTINPDSLPEGIANYSFTGAYKIWKETNYGEGSIVAVVDTGTARNSCLQHAVIGAPGFPDGYNATNDGIPATDRSNYWHGTFVAGEIASSCSISFTDPSHLLYQAISAHLPWGPEFVPILGQAPAAKIYPVKVFPASGQSVPTSTILSGLDHILTLKKQRILDVDIVNMSLGGPTPADGLDIFDRFIEELVKEGMLVVTSAGNGGPTPNTIGSPATSYLSLAVGALDYAPTTRVEYEYWSLDYFQGSGNGQNPRTPETRIAYFSARGPLSDGRAGPDIVALGFSNFQATSRNGLAFAEGTSFSAPTVAGAAALLSAYWKSSVKEINPLILHTALLAGANPNVVGAQWRDINDQGWGALDVARSLELLKQRPIPPGRRIGLSKANALKDPKNALIEPWLKKFVVRMIGERRASFAKRWIDVLNPRSGVLESNVMSEPVKGEVETWESDYITLVPGEKRDFIIEIEDCTSEVTIEGIDLEVRDNSKDEIAPYFWNSIYLQLQSAKRTDYTAIIREWWYPWHPLYTDYFRIGTKDLRGWRLNNWLCSVQGWCRWYEVREANDRGVMSPGLMKFTLTASPLNPDPARFKVRITRKNLREPPTELVASGEVNKGDLILIPVEIPWMVGDRQLTTSIFVLDWSMRWDKFPTSDLDVYFYRPDGSFYDPTTSRGATANAPEKAVVYTGMGEYGTWQVLIVGSELYTPDYYSLFWIKNPTGSWPLEPRE